MIALLTDFGLTDHYVAVMKGSMLSVNPNAVIIDICHAIKPQAIREGAFILKEAYSSFPKGTIFVAVVDPGVGSNRRALCIQTSRGYLIGPDNGVLALALESETDYVIREIQNDQYFRKPVSATFHGRDIFGPTAAWLTKENIFTKMGPVLQNIQKLPMTKAHLEADSIVGEIIYVDHFGNALTNIPRKMVKTGKKQVRVRSVQLKKICGFFSEGEAGKLMAVWNSSEVLELAVPNGSAAVKFGLKTGDKVRVS